MPTRPAVRSGSPNSDASSSSLLLRGQCVRERDAFAGRIDDAQEELPVRLGVGCRRLADFHQHGILAFAQRDFEAMAVVADAVAPFLEVKGADAVDVYREIVIGGAAKLDLLRGGGKFGVGEGDGVVGVAEGLRVTEVYERLMPRA